MTGNEIYEISTQIITAISVIGLAIFFRKPIANRLSRIKKIKFGKSSLDISTSTDSIFEKEDEDRARFVKIIKRHPDGLIALYNNSTTTIKPTPAELPKLIPALQQLESTGDLTFTLEKTGITVLVTIANAA